MASPFTRGTIADFANTAAGAGTDVLVNLQTGESKGLGTITSAADDADVWVNPLVVKTVAAGSFAAGDFLEVYVAVSEDDVDWSHGIDPDTTTDMTDAVQALQLVDRVELNADATTFRTRGFSLLDRLGAVQLPKYWGLIVYLNSVNAAADLSNTGSDHRAEYIRYTWA